MTAGRLLGAIAAGGALGAVARYGVSLVALTMFPGFAQLGTLAANVAGSFLIGLIAIWSVRRLPPTILNGFLVTGFCGGFTTFSVFSLEVLVLALGGYWPAALGYAALSIVTWLGAVWLGWTVGSLVFPARP